jgi:hypothetical protein
VPRAAYRVRVVRRAIQVRGATTTPTRCPCPGAVHAAATLLLNATYEPLCVVSSRRAIVLVLADKAVLGRQRAEEVHAETVSLPVPVVAR